MKNMIKNGFLHIFFGSLLSKAVAFISGILVVRLLTQDDFSIFAYVDNIYGYVTILSGLGLSSAFLKIAVTEKNEQKQFIYFNYVLKKGSLIQFIGSLLVVFFLLIQYFDTNKTTILFGLSLIFYPVLNYIFTLVQNYNRVHSLNKIYSKSSVILSIVLSVLTILFVSTLGLMGISLARYIALIVAIFFGASYAKKSFEKRTKIKISKTDRELFKKTGYAMLISESVSQLISVNETFLVNNLIDIPNVSGLFKVSILLPAQLFIVTSSIVIYFFPIVANASPMDKIKLLKKTWIVNAIVISTLCIIGILLTKPFVTMIYGVEYIDSIKISYMMWCVYGMNLIFRQIPMSLLPAFGDVKFNAINATTLMIIHFILEIILFPIIGIKAILIVNMLVYSISGISYVIFINKKYKQK